MIKQWDTSGHAPDAVGRIGGGFGWLTGMEASGAEGGNGEAFQRLQLQAAPQPQRREDEGGEMRVRSYQTVFVFV